MRFNPTAATSRHAQTISLAPSSAQHRPPFSLAASTQADLQPHHQRIPHLPRKSTSNAPSAQPTTTTLTKQSAPQSRNSTPHQATPTTAAMAERQLTQVLTQLKSNTTLSYAD